jgi:hypothetical protein
MGAGGHHAADFAFAATACFAKQCGGEGESKIASARPGRTGEKPSVMNPAVTVFDSELQLGNRFGLAS